MTPVDQIQKIARRGYNDAITALASVEILEAGNTPQVIAALSRRPAGSSLKIIRFALFSNLVLMVCRFFDPIRNGDQHLRVAVNLLQDPATRAAVGKKGNPVELEQAISLYAKADADPRQIHVRHVRNKELAHLSDRNPDIPRPLVIETFSFARDVAQIAEAMAFGAGVASVRLEAQLRVHRVGSAELWQPWTEVADQQQR
jgi:hypothetical protein